MRDVSKEEERQQPRTAEDPDRDGVGCDRDATHMGEGAERGLGRSATVTDARGEFRRSLGADGRRRGAAGAGGRGRHAGCRRRRGREGGCGVLLAVQWRAGRDHHRGEVACLLFSRRAAPRRASLVSPFLFLFPFPLCVSSAMRGRLCLNTRRCGTITACTGACAFETGSLCSCAKLARGTRTGAQCSPRPPRR